MAACGWCALSAALAALALAGCAGSGVNAALPPGATAATSALAVPTPPQAQLLGGGSARFGTPATTSAPASATTVPTIAAGSAATTAVATTSSLAAASPLGGPSVRLYLSQQTVDQLATFFDETLAGEGWTGSFDTPSTSPLASVTQSSTSSAPGAAASSSQAPRVGTFIGVDSAGATILFVELHGAASAGGPTYVEVIEQRAPRASQ